jgi:hypothetical protein
MKTKITTEQAIDLIQQNVRGTMMVAITAVTEPKMRKTGNPYAGMIRKTCDMTGVVGFDYEKSVNRQDVREGGEGDRVAQPRQWGVLTEDRLFVLHKGNTYLQMKVESATDPIYTDLNGNVIPVEVLKPYMGERSSSSTQEGIKKEVVVRDISFENIKGMRFMSADYAIV